MKVHERFCTKTGFEEEAKANSEVVRSLMQNTWTLSYFYIFNSVILWSGVQSSEVGSTRVTTDVRLRSSSTKETSPKRNNRWEVVKASIIVNRGDPSINYASIYLFTASTWGGWIWQFSIARDNIQLVFVLSNRFLSNLFIFLHVTFFLEENDLHKS